MNKLPRDIKLIIYEYEHRSIYKEVTNNIYEELDQIRYYYGVSNWFTSIIRCQNCKGWRGWLDDKGVKLLECDWCPETEEYHCVTSLKDCEGCPMGKMNIHNTHA